MAHFRAAVGSHGVAMIAVMEVAVAAAGGAVVAPLQRLPPILPGLFNAVDDAMFGCGVTVAGGTFMASAATSVFSRPDGGLLMTAAMAAVATNSGSS